MTGWLHPYDEGYPHEELTMTTQAGQVRQDMTLDEAIGYALLETEHIGGFARRGPAFRARLAEAGYYVTQPEYPYEEFDPRSDPQHESPTYDPEEQDAGWKRYDPASGRCWNIACGEHPRHGATETQDGERPMTRSIDTTHSAHIATPTPDDRDREVERIAAALRPEIYELLYDFEGEPSERYLDDNVPGLARSLFDAGLRASGGD